MLFKYQLEGHTNPDKYGVVECTCVGFFTRCTAGFVVFVLVWTGPPSTAKLADHFEDGMADRTIALEAPDCCGTVSFLVPAKSHVCNATITVSTMAPVDGRDGYPGGVTLSLGPKPVWSYNRTGFGGLGRQTEFPDGNTGKIYNFSGAGGTIYTSFLLPKDAVIQDAYMTLVCRGTGQLVSMFNVTGSGGTLRRAGDVNGDGIVDVLTSNAPYGNGPSTVSVMLGNAFQFGSQSIALYNSSPNDSFGYSIAGAGDVNGDGCDDVIVGSGFTSGSVNRTGGAYIYFGGPSMDATPDVTLLCGTAGNAFGFSVSGAGDVNGDGYDDVVVGDPQNDTGRTDAGAAYIFFGGPGMDARPDVTMISSTANDYFGYSVAGAGDLNGDGYDDVVATASSTAYRFLGGPTMDAANDGTLSFPSQITYARAMPAGDLNADGFGDVLVGGYQTGTEVGRVAVHLGGPSMDVAPEALLSSPTGSMDNFGSSFCGQVDVNEDGCDDVIVGAFYRRAVDYMGCVHVFLGGSIMDSTVDYSFMGTTQYDCFGYSVLGAGDINSDGQDEVLVSVPAYSRINVMGPQLGLNNTALGIEGNRVWGREGFYNGTTVIAGIKDLLADHLDQEPPMNISSDVAMVPVHVSVSATSSGRVTLTVNVTYSLTTTTRDFSDTLRNYIDLHRSEADARGNISVPLLVRARSEGRLRLSGLNVDYDPGPQLAAPIPDIFIEECSLNERILCVASYFWDDYDGPANLSFRIWSITNSKYATVWLADGVFLSAESLVDDEGNNWTGVVDISVACTDMFGLVTVSNIFKITVRRHDNPPVFTSDPPLVAPAGRPYWYVLGVNDSDNDSIVFGLEKCPEGMTVDSVTGRIDWLPMVRGTYPVVATASDGRETARQHFNITVPDVPPQITSTPPSTVILGAQLNYTVTAVDEEGDPMKCQFWTNARNTTFDPLGWRLTWRPVEAGSFNFSFVVSDGFLKTYQNFTMEVIRPNRAPGFTSSPAARAAEDTHYLYDANAIDDDNDTLSYVLLVWPTGMSVDASSGLLNWTPAEAGEYSVLLSVRDGNGGEAWQQFNITVSEAIAPKISITSPGKLSRVQGDITVQGRAARGTRELRSVEVRLDDGPWTRASGTANWTFNLDTRGLREGRHTVHARAYDGKVYSQDAKVEFDVSQGEFLSLDNVSVVGIVIASLLVVLAVLIIAALRRRR